MGYVKTLSKQALSNIKVIASTCKARGINNPVSIAGILSIISKESGFIPKYEQGYSGTSVARIRKIFPTTFKNFTDKFIMDLRQDDVRFFNFLYGGRFGNSPLEGYRYRGAGLNQLTFKNNYKRAGELIGVDLVSDPDKVNEIENAAAVVVEFMKASFEKSPKTVLSRYGTSDINGFNDLEISAKAFYNANAGFGKDTRNSSMDGYAKALSRVDELYGLIHF